MSKLIGRLLVVLAFGWAGHIAAAPITDIVTVDGKNWAQVDLFTSLSWSDISSVCPGGICGTGTLNGYDMYGWNWATTEELNKLLNHYIGAPVMGPGPDSFLDSGGVWAAGFFADGWRATDNIFFDSSETYGRMSDNSTLVSEIGYWIGGQISVAYTNFDPVSINNAPIQVGGWFYSSVPTPATLPLLGIGLAALGFSRRKHKQHNLAT